MPSSPAAITPPSEMYGLALESDDLSSTLVDSDSWPLNGDATRSAPRRLSGPHARNADAHICGCRRRYELTEAQVSATSAGRWSRMPAMNWRARGERLDSAPASEKRVELGSGVQPQKCRGQPLPAWSAEGLGAKDA